MDLKEGIKEGKVKVIEGGFQKVTSGLNLFRIFYEYKVVETVKRTAFPDVDVPAYRTDLITVASRGNKPYTNIEEALSERFPDREIVKVFDPIRVCNCVRSRDTTGINIGL